MPSKKKKVLNPEELQDLTTVERIHFHLISPKEFELQKRDLDYLENLRAAWSIANENPVKYKQVKLTAEALMISERQARNILDDADKVFAPIYESNQEIDKNFITQYLLRLAEKAEESDYLDTAKACIIEIAKINGHYNKELAIKPEDLQVNITITSDPKALQESQPEIEDADVIE